MFIFELLTLEKTIYGYHLLEYAKYFFFSLRMNKILILDFSILVRKKKKKGF